MMVLVTGGSGSGKSEYAENRVVQSGLPFRYYIATMKVWGQEEKDRIRRHQIQRSGKGFRTMEAQEDLDQIVIPSEWDKTAVLLECMTNLAANELFRETQMGERKDGLKDTRERILNGIRSLMTQCALLVIVTGQVDQDGGSYGEGTRTYMQLLGQVNSRLAHLADQAVEVVVGIPLILNGMGTGKGGDSI